MHFKHEFIIKNAVQRTRFFCFTSNCEFNEEDERKYFWQKSRPQWIVIHIGLGSEATYHHNRRCHPPCCLRCCCCCRLLLTYRVVILTRWVILSALSPSDELWTESVSFCLPNRRRQQRDGLDIALHALRVTHHDRENTGKLRPTKNIRKVQAGKETAIFYRSKNWTTTANIYYWTTTTYAHRTDCTTRTKKLLDTSKNNIFGIDNYVRDPLEYLCSFYGILDVSVCIQNGWTMNGLLFLDAGPCERRQSARTRQTQAPLVSAFHSRPWPPWYCWFMPSKSSF